MLAGQHLSLFYQPDDKVLPGLPILTYQLAEVYEAIEEKGIYPALDVGSRKNMSAANAHLRGLRIKSMGISKSTRRII